MEPEAASSAHLELGRLPVITSVIIIPPPIVVNDPINTPCPTETSTVRSRETSPPANFELGRLPVITSVITIPAPIVENEPINTPDPTDSSMNRSGETSVHSKTSSSSLLEENVTLKKCLEIYNSNKLCKANAWSLSLIDTLSNCLLRHHKSFNNFSMAGSSLEASSKIYGLRVDSIHSDVLRITAGLNAQKFKQRNDDEIEEVSGSEANNEPNNNVETQAPRSKVKKRKHVSSVTKNKDTINARLDTVPQQDPFFGKLNSVVGSINSSNRLINNLLLTIDSELCLKSTNLFWSAPCLPQCDYTEEVELNAVQDMELFTCDRLFKIKHPEELKLRPLHGGFVISDTPDRDTSATVINPAPNEDLGDIAAVRGHEMEMAFDINAECEPMSIMFQQEPLIDVICEELDEDEFVALQNCRGLRQTPRVIEDLRPIDANSSSEYYYCPLEKINKFWAGPSYWKFKRARPQTLGRRKPKRKPKSKKLKLGEIHDDVFLKYDETFKGRKVNVLTWNESKLKLPFDFQVDANRFNTYSLAPALTSNHVQNFGVTIRGGSDEDTLESVIENMEMDAQFNGFNDVCHNENFNNGMADDAESDHMPVGGGILNETVLEIASNFEGAPSQINKIKVPFAKSAKIVDMKKLKATCSGLLTKQLQQPIKDADLPQHSMHKKEQYDDGVASFQQTYKQLPTVLSDKMSEAVTPAIAFYSMLHLANEQNFRLFQQDDLKDFKIRKVGEN